MSPPALPPDETVRALTAEILQRHEYAQWRWVPNDAWTELLQWLANLFARIDTLAVDSPVAYWSLLLALGTLATALIAHIAWTVRIALAAPAPARERPEAPLPPDFAGQARWLAGQGRFLEAAQRLQLATLEILVARGVLQLARHDPNRVLLRRLEDSALPADQRAELATLIRRLERRWFRDRSAQPDLYEDWRALHSRLARQPGAGA